MSEWGHSMRITNFHLVLSFLILAVAGWFAYQKWGKPLATRHLGDRPPASDILPDTEPPAAPEIEEKRQRVRALLDRAQSTFGDAVIDGKNVQPFAPQLDDIRRRIDAAQLLEELISLELKLQKMTSDIESASTASSSSAPERLSRYVVQRGDNLWTIAKRPDVFGRGSGWVRLWRHNEKRIPDFDHLLVGQAIDIPEQ